MSIASEISRLQTAKADIKSSIEEKGVTVPSNIKIDGYAELISSISGGAGGSCLGSIDVTGLGETITLYEVFFRGSSTGQSWVPLNEGTDYNINNTRITFSRDIVGILRMTFVNYDPEVEFEIVLTITDTGGGGGGAAPYIVNPLNGSIFGGSDRRGGTYTHQYQLSSGNVVDAYLAKGSFSRYTEPEADDNHTGFDENGHIKWILSNYFPCRLEINNSGLLTLTLGESDYEWLHQYKPAMLVILISDEGYTFVDNFDVYSEYTCFVKGTKITLSNGEKKAVENITYKDNLLIWNFDEGKYGSAKPLWIKKVQTTTWYYKLKFSNGLELNVTGAYPEAHSLFSVEDGKFIHSNRLVGKKVYTLNGIATLDSCEEIHEEVEFYNIITNYHLNLFANGVLSSTSLNNIYPIKDMKFIKEDREPVFDYTQFSDDWVVGARLKEQPTDVTEYCLNCIKLSKK